MSIARDNVEKLRNLPTDTTVVPRSTATMTTLLSEATVDTINVQGYYSINDGGGGIFNWDSAQDKANANGGTIIDPSVSLALQGTGSGTGCWVRPQRGRVSVKWFGAKGDNSTNDSAAIQAAMDSFETTSAGVGFEGGIVYFPSGVYVCNITFKNQLSLVGEHRFTTYLKANDPTSPILTISSRASTHAVQLKFGGVYDLHFVGNGATSNNKGIYVEAESPYVVKDFNFHNLAFDNMDTAIETNAIGGSEVFQLDFRNIFVSQALTNSFNLDMDQSNMDNIYVDTMKGDVNRKGLITLSGSNNRIGHLYGGMSIILSSGNSLQIKYLRFENYFAHRLIPGANSMISNNIQNLHIENLVLQECGRPNLWVTATVVKAGEHCVYSGNHYYTVNGGTTGATPPTHTTGTVSDGGVDWTFIEAWTEEEFKLGYVDNMFYSYELDFYIGRVVQSGNAYIDYIMAINGSAQGNGATLLNSNLQTLTPLSVNTSVTSGAATLLGYMRDRGLRMDNVYYQNWIGIGHNAEAVCKLYHTHNTGTVTGLFTGRRIFQVNVLNDNGSYGCVMVYDGATWVREQDA